MSRSVADDLRRMGFDSDQIAGALIDGKPLAEVADKPKPKSQYKSKAESLYADYLQSRMGGFGVEWWAYEPVTLVIVDANGVRCRYTPDFAVINTGTEKVAFIEVKGFLREAARLRFLAARERYPFWDFFMMRRSPGGRWELLL